MSNYKDLESTITRLEESTALLESLQAEIKSFIAEAKFRIVGFPQTNINSQIKYNKFAIAALTYWRETLERLNIENMIFGHYIHIYFDLFDNNKLTCKFYLADQQIADKLYNQVFGSHSNTVSFFSNQIIPIISLVLGDESYDEKLGSFSLDLIPSMVEKFGTKEWRGQQTISGSDLDYIKALKMVKRIIDWFAYLQSNMKLQLSVKRVLDCYFKEVLENNFVK